MPINNYESYKLPAFEGMMPKILYDAKFGGIQNQLINRTDLNAASYAANTVTNNVIPYGRFVARTSVQGNSAGNFSNPTETAVSVHLVGNGTSISSIIGVAVGTNIREKKTLTNFNNAPINGTAQQYPGYDLFEPVVVLRNGLVWVFSETTLSVGNTVFVRATAPTVGTNQAYGRVRNSNSGTDAAFASNFISVVRGTANPNGGMVLLEIKLEGLNNITP